jgi:hypothetical protein
MRPIIVLGAARSGTKFLRDTLAAAGDLAAVPYDVNYIWRSCNEKAPDDALTPERCTPRAARLIRDRLRRLAGLRKGEERRRFIEKTVSNTLRLEFVARVFPDADFVHLIRDGRDVVESSVRQWMAPTDWSSVIAKARRFPLRNYQYALWYAANRLRVGVGRRGQRPIWGVRYPGIAADLAAHGVPVVCARQWIHSVRSVLESRARLPGLRFWEVRYEDLVRDEASVLDLGRALGLQDLDSVAAYYRRRVSRDGARGWDFNLTASEREAVLGELSPWLRRLGYDADREREEARR